MSDCHNLEHTHGDGLKRRISITGKKLEQPVRNDPDYWKKFCDDEAKKLIIVRNPFLKLSYKSFSKNRPDLVELDSRVIDKVSDWNTFSKFYTDNNKASENSLHTLSPTRLKSKRRKDHFDGKESISTPILTAPSPAATKVSDITSDLAASSKIVRIPKLDTLGPQPSSGKILPGKVDRIRASFGTQNKPKVRRKSSSTLPVLGTFSKAPDPELTLRKLRKHLGLPEKKGFRINGEPRNNVAQVENNKPSFKVDQIVPENRNESIDEECAKYSVRFAYKALKRVTKNKNLNFKPVLIEHSSRELSLASKDDFFVSDDEEVDSLEVKDIVEHEEEESEEEEQEEEHSAFPSDTQKDSERNSVKDSEFTCTDVERDALKSKATMSKTIPTSSRSTSGPSPQSVYPENRESPSSRILASIPKLSGYPRRNRDRCWPCMYKSFETPPERKISLPKTLLQRILHSQSGNISSSCSSSGNSDSTSLNTPSFESELENSSNHEVETTDEKFDDESDAPKSRIVTEPSSISQEKREQAAEAAKQKNIPDSEAPRKTIKKDAKRDEREDDSISKNFCNVTVSPTKSASLEGTKVSPSFQSESSEEDDSNVVSISDDRSKPKFLVPCHAPTNFRPSLEPLRALRNRKPTTLQDRIAMLESTSSKKSASNDDYHDVPKEPRPTSKKTDDKEQTSGGGKSIPLPLKKSKSDLEQLSLEKAKTSTEKQRHVLRKGISLSSFPRSTDTTTDTPEIYSDASKGESGKSDTIGYDNLFQTNLDKNFSATHRRSGLPLTNPGEVAELLRNLDGNTSTTDMLETLCKEFSKRLSSNVENNDSRAKERNEMIATLIRLLVDSKRYLRPDKFPSDLHFSTIQPPACNPQFLKQMLPLKTYNAVAPLLDMPESYPLKASSFQVHDGEHCSKVARDGKRLITPSFNSLQVHLPTMKDTESTDDEEKVGQRRYNPYGLFLTKPRRKVVRWRPLTKRDLEGYDPYATLEMRAEKMMKRICQDFCEWVDSLGGTDKVIDEEVLRDMFEIDFSAEACRAIQVSIREMPVVPAEVAITRTCPGAGKLTMTKKHVMKDVKAEQTPARTVAFGTALPWDLRFVPPKNRVQQKWLECETVPQDLETMDVVWKDITHLKSVRGFVEWLQQHPEVPPPEALKKIVSMDIGALRQTEEDETFAHLELDIDQIQSLRVGVNSNA